MNLNAIENIWQDYLSEYIYAFGIILAFYILCRIISGFIIPFLLALTKKAQADFANKLVQSFQRPLTWIVIFLGFYVAGLRLFTPDYRLLLTRTFRSAVVILISQGFYNLVGTTSGLFAKIANAYDLNKLFLSLLSKTLRVIIIAIGFTILAQEWGYDVNGFVAGLGIGGLAFALAAQDTIANIFGGIVILVEKPFTIGDWILSKDVEGMVEDITFRSTKVRTFAQALVTVPNSALAKQAITNWTRMGRRRISFTLGVAKNTSRQEMKQILDKIRDMLSTHPEVHPATIFANFDKFGEYSLDILIYCFTKTTAWGQWLQVKEDILFKIMAILEEEGVKLALPVRSIMKEESQQE